MKSTISGAAVNPFPTRGDPCPDCTSEDTWPFDGILVCGDCLRRDHGIPTEADLADMRDDLGNVPDLPSREEFDAMFAALGEPDPFFGGVPG